MGSLQSKLPDDIARHSLEIFQKHELKEINDTFQKLSTRYQLQTPRGTVTRHGIDRDCFTQYFSYPGVLREQIFKIFDQNGDGYIDREEFLRGLAMCCKGTIEEKMQFCFAMVDISGDGNVDREELTRTLESTAFASCALLQAVAIDHGELEATDMVDQHEFDAEIETMVEEAFRFCDVNDDGTLSYDEFKMWMLNSPEIVQILYSVFAVRDHVDTTEVTREFEQERQRREFEDASGGEKREESLVTLIDDNRRLTAERAKRLEDLSERESILSSLIAENQKLNAELRVIKRKMKAGGGSGGMAAGAAEVKEDDAAELE